MTNLLSKFSKFLFCFLSVFCFALSASHACSRALWISEEGVVIARTMDWAGSLDSNMFVYPRGMQRDGLAEVNSLTWVSKYGSIATAAYDALATDGFNEKGLAAHIFWLEESDYGTRTPSVPGMSVLMWEQFYLDNFATVDEAVAYTNNHPFQLEAFSLDSAVNLHLIISDATGDTAIFEYIDGKLHTYHGRELTVTTNSPSFDQQLENLHQYKGFGGNKSLPGTTNSKDRFVRAAFYASHLPKAASGRDAIIKILSVIDSTVQPFSTVGESGDASMSGTIWRTALDLTHRVYYYESASDRSLVWINLDDFNLQKGAPVYKLELANRTGLSGNVAKEFKPLPSTQTYSVQSVKRAHRMAAMQHQK